MTEEIIIDNIDETWIKLTANQGILQELSELLTFDVEGAAFMPSFRKKYWDGKIRLLKGDKLYKGLLKFVEKFCKERDYSFKTKIKQSDFDIKFYDDFISSLKLRDEKGNVLEARDYQLEAIKKGITNNRKVFLSPTASGKSYIIAALIKFYKEEIPGKILLLVPNISLVEQMYSDFKEYFAGDKSFIVEEEVGKIYSGQERLDRKLTISTWQSLYDLPKNNFHDFDMVIADEVHLFKSKEISKLLEKLYNAKYRFGFTGTLDNVQCHELTLTGLFGPISRMTTTSKLINENKLSKLKVNCLVMGYSEQEKKAAQHFTWEDEVQFLISHQERTKFIAKLATSLKGNSLVLFSRVETHGELIFDEISKLTDRPVYYIHGGTNPKDREETRSLVETHDTSIIVASSQIFAQGINIKSLANIIFSHPSKSRIRVLQSIGRVLRLSEKKSESTLYDIADDLRHNGKVNFSLRHFEERVKIYASEEFPYAIKSFQLRKTYQPS